MQLYELFLIAIGLSMDAFAVAVCRGLSMKRLNYRHAAIIAGFFGVFQGGMPLLGWMLGRRFEEYVTRFDHWIAFGLLTFIGGKMLLEALRRKQEEKTSHDGQLPIKELLSLSIATSIDALAVGITFAFLRVSILPSITFIGCITFILSFLGAILGSRFGLRYKNKAKAAGGIVLILMGGRILFTHLNL